MIKKSLESRHLPDFLLYREKVKCYTGKVPSLLAGKTAGRTEGAIHTVDHVIKEPHYRKNRTIKRIV